jgi:tetratricopeptide (TPR) repeat protein
VKVLFFALFGAALMLTSQPASAQVSQAEFDLCSGITRAGDDMSPDDSSDEVHIDYCTKLIESGRTQTVRELAFVYVMRAEAYENMDRNDLAIADYRRAMKIDPSYAAPSLGLIFLGVTP